MNFFSCLAHFSIGEEFCFCLFPLLRLHIRKTSALSVIHIANIFSKIVNCLLILCCLLFYHVHLPLIVCSQMYQFLFSFSFIFIFAYGFRIIVRKSSPTMVCVLILSGISLLAPILVFPFAWNPLTILLFLAFLFEVCLLNRAYGWVFVSQVENLPF